MIIHEIPPNRLKALKNIPILDAPNPSYIIHTDLLKDNCKVFEYIKKKTNAKILLAQKAYSCFNTYPIINKYLDGTTSSGLNEALLAKKYFGKEIHVYSPAYTPKEIIKLKAFSHTINFNSFTQLEMGINHIKSKSKLNLGLRVNPEYSTTKSKIYDPCIPNSRLGMTIGMINSLENKNVKKMLENISGLHFHTLCQQDAIDLEKTAFTFEKKFKHLIKECEWLNFGGGHLITNSNYNIKLLCEIIEYFQKNYSLNIYLEPGEAVVANTGILNTKILDIIDNKNKKIAILNTSATCHMPDVIEMPYTPRIINAHKKNTKTHNYILGGLSCLSGDIIGSYSFSKPLKINENIQFLDMSQYTMVKTTTFNGINLPSICTYSKENGLQIIKNFTFKDYIKRI